MEIRNVTAMYFSATGTTKKVARFLSDGLSEALSAACAQIDFTLPAGRKKSRAFSQDELVVFGVPVYAGRVPNVLLPFLKEKIKGGGALAVPIVLYGNRNYDDALIELRDILTAQGFCCVGGGAFIGEHSFSDTLGAKRPDERDMAVAEGFFKKIAELIKSCEAVPQAPVSVRGETPPRPYYTPRDRRGNPVNILKVKPKTKASCVRCGLCAKLCPMGSIDVEKPDCVTGICIKCGACVKGCPLRAKYYDDAAYLYHQQELEKGFSRRAEPEIFVTTYEK